MKTIVLEQPLLSMRELTPERLSDLPKVAQQVNCGVKSLAAFSEDFSSTLGWAMMGPAGFWGVGPWHLGCKTPGMWPYK